jgi:hypothetical protein
VLCTDIDVGQVVMVLEPTHANHARLLATCPAGRTILLVLCLNLSTVSATTHYHHHSEHHRHSIFLPPHRQILFPPLLSNPPSKSHPHLTPPHPHPHTHRLII